MAAVFLTSLLALGATALPQAIPSGGLTGQTSNDIQNGACKPVSFIFARGTTETGNLGETVGPALTKDLQQMLGAGNVAVQGVNYPADIEGAAQGSINPKGAAGSQNMAMFAAKAVQQCPTTKLVLSGYSQGAQQVHGALENMDSATTAKVAAAVTFGDPLDKTAPTFQGVPAANTKIFCATGDEVCDDEFVISAAHLSYATTSTGPAAQFIASKVGTGAASPSAAAGSSVADDQRKQTSSMSSGAAGLSSRGKCSIALVILSGVIAFIL